ncbi:hypothetical protein MKZ38_004796 [Zalerion maritima]|uniref:Uncharacterized protein n=1 Tax=Zalerion maritima TaxID=339359 RepID=A0AAD5RLL2_9PEZI|nr:hypothetical protein MKZ38_004796 [Zalerion maritima]
MCQECNKEFSDAAERQKPATPDLPNSSTDEGHSVGLNTPYTISVAAGIPASVVVEESGKSVYVGLHNKKIKTLNASDTPATPDPQATINNFFDKLLDVCDLPDMNTGLLEISYYDQKKYTVTNYKYSFINKLLQHIRNFKYKVLIVCKEGPVFDLLGAILKTAGYKFNIHKEKKVLEGLDPTIILASSSQDVNAAETQNSPAAFARFAAVLKNPSGYHEPPSPVITFGELLQNPDKIINWEPVQIPKGVTDFFRELQRNLQGEMIADRESNPKVGG